MKKMIAKHAIDYKKPLYSQWFIETDDSVQVWHDRMKEVADTDDNWFIFKIGRSNRQGWLNRNVWTWLKERSGD
ncbi:hypothetical protein [Nocardioides marmoraquaticus]